jgi:hypothetical protein
MKKGGRGGGRPMRGGDETKRRDHVLVANTVCMAMMYLDTHSHISTHSLGWKNSVYMNQKKIDFRVLSRIGSEACSTQHPSCKAPLSAHLLSLGVFACSSHGLTNICSCFRNHNVATATKRQSYTFRYKVTFALYSKRTLSHVHHCSIFWYTFLRTMFACVIL